MPASQQRRFCSAPLISSSTPTPHHSLLASSTTPTNSQRCPHHLPPQRWRPARQPPPLPSLAPPHPRSPRPRSTPPRRSTPSHPSTSPSPLQELRATPLQNALDTHRPNARRSRRGRAALCGATELGIGLLPSPKPSCVAARRGAVRSEARRFGASHRDWRMGCRGRIMVSALPEPSGAVW